MFFSFRRGSELSLVFLLLAGCSGSNDGPVIPKGDTTTDNTQTGTSQPDSTSVMVCPGGPNVQCSGGTILRSDNGIALTASGVQTYGISTNDLQTPNPDTTHAYGLLPASGGIVEVRSQRNDSGQLSGVALLLSKMGLSWDGKTERPQVIDTFSTLQGRVQMDAKGLITLIPLPPPTDLNFYDYAKKGTAATQANYANNIYFPRSEPVRCPSNYPDCPQIESPPMQITSGDWRTGGDLPDSLSAMHLHEDGATQAGFGLDASGNQILLPAADGIGVSYPGFKGYRDYSQWSYAYANIARWVTQDTVMINEWGGNNEHNKMRRGAIAFGQVSDPTKIPATGTATYRGRLHGWFVYDPSQEPYPLAGDVEIVVDFAAHNAELRFINARIDEGTSPAVPVNVSTTIQIGSSSLANYLNGTASNGSISGGIGARFFGPVAGGGPAEIGGSFSLQGTATDPVAIGSFLLKKL